jgi:YVTN family beta-propeller protein
LERAILLQDPTLDLPPAKTTPKVAVAAGTRTIERPEDRAADTSSSAAESTPETKLVAPKRGRRVVALSLIGLILAGALASSLVFVFPEAASPRAVLIGRSIGNIDLRTMRVQAAELGGSGALAVADGLGAVWVASSGGNTVLRVAPSTSTVRDSIDVGSSPAGVATGAGSVWVTNSGNGTVTRLNPETDQVVATIRVGNGPTGIAVGGSSVWVANSLDGTITRLRATDGRQVSTVAVGGTPTGVAAYGNSVWVTDRSNDDVIQLDVRTGAIIGTVHVGDEPTAVAADRGALWVANTLDGTVWRIDPSSDSVTAVASVGRQASSVAIAAGQVWAASAGGVLSRLDPRSGQVVKQIHVSAGTDALAGDRRRLWVAAQPGVASHRGGTLRVALPQGLDSTDPNSSFSGDSERLLSLVFDGLVGYRHTAGAAGAELVPDLARSVPQPTNGGTTYTFRLRQGLRFSDGRQVRARDVRYSLERTIRLGVSPFHGGILGAARCTSKRCDLSSGIQIDDRTGLVTIRLRKPDPDFLYALALPLSAVVPFGAPLRIAPERLPGTGPYRIVANRGTQRLVLARNPRFRPLAPEAQPDGYPDRIVAQVYSRGAVAAVERGRLDWAEVPPLYPTTPLVTHFGGQLYLSPTLATVFPFLNERVAPFDSLRARRAFNYAVDRAYVAHLFGGSLVAQPTCQILPPGFPGFRPYCPYTRDPSAAGTWTSANVALARRLVARSGTSGTHVTVWTDGSDAFKAALGKYLVRVLDQLGYRADLRKVSQGYFPAVLQGNPQVGFYDWAADFPEPLNFLEPNFECGSPLYPGHLCSRRLGAAISQAARFSALGDPRAAGRWAAVDRLLVDQAAGLPLIALRSGVLVSPRVGNVENNPQYGTLLDQLWVR